MLNAEGRGFPGFKVIVAEEQMPPAQARMPVPGSPGAAARAARTTSAHDLVPPGIPAHSKPKGSRSGSSGMGRAQRTNYWWHKVQGTFGAWVVYSSGSLEKKFELARTGWRNPGREADGDGLRNRPGLGETSRACVIVNGETPIRRRLRLYATRRDHGARYAVLQNDLTAWILGRRLLAKC